MEHDAAADRPKNAGFRLMQRLMHIYWRVSRGMTLGVRAVALSADGQILLVRHSYTEGWHFPGGGVEPGESLLDALGKELREEANVRMTGAPALHGVFFNAHVSRRDHVAVFVVRDFEVLGPHVPDREILEARLFPLAALPEGVTPGTARRLAEVTARAPVSERW